MSTDYTKTIVLAGDIEGIVKTIAAIEQSFDVNSVRYKSLLLWPLVRLTLWQKLTNLSKNLTINEGPVSNHIPCFSIDDDSLRTLHDLNDTEILFFTRAICYTKRSAGEHYDHLLDPVMSFIENTHRCLCVEIADMKNIRETTPRSKPTFFLKRIRNGQVEDTVTRIENFDKLQQIVTELTGIFIDESLYLKQLRDLMAKQHYFMEVLSVIRPRVMFTSCYMRHEAMAMISACKKLGIMTVDIQHGKPPPSHASYSHWTSIPSGGYDLVADYFWCWNQLRKNMNESTSSHGMKPHSIVGGNLWLAQWLKEEDPVIDDDMRNFYRYLNEKSKVVLLAMARPDIPIPSHVIDAMRYSPPEWLWLIRLHSTWYKDTDKMQLISFLKESGVNNYEMEYASSCPLPGVLKRSDHHITFYSSTCYEAMVFDVPTTFIDNFAFEAHKSNIEKGVFAYADNAESLLDSIRNFRHDKNINKHDFIETRKEYAQNALQTILNDSLQISGGANDENSHLQRRSLSEKLFKEGFYCLRDGDALMAVRYLEEAAAMSPLLANIHYPLAALYIQLGDLSAARKACEMELRIQPGHDGALGLIKKIEKALNKSITEFVIK